MKVSKIWIAVAIVVVVILTTIVYNWNRNPGSFSIFEGPKIEQNDWTPFASIQPNDSLNVLKVVYQEKYGSEKTIYCKVIFDNTKTAEYKCVAPWLDLILEKSNLNSFKFSTISKDSM